VAYSRRNRVALLAVFVSLPLGAAPTDSGDFSPLASRIGFDTLAPGQYLSDQFLNRGVRLRDTTGRPLRVIYPQTLGLDTQTPQGAIQSRFILPSQGQDLITGPSSAGIVIDFTTGQDRVGFYFAGYDNNASGVLHAYDADGNLLDSVSVTAKDPGVTNFIGIDHKPGTIRRVVFQQNGVELIDELIFEPGPSSSEEALEQALDEGRTRAERLAAVDELMLYPSPAAVEALRKLANDEDDPDVYLRERAVIALEQLYAYEALPDLLRLGRHTHRPLALAAYNAAWTLRQAFPPPDQPELTLELLKNFLDPDDGYLKVLIRGVISAGTRIEVEASLAGGKGAIQPRRNLVFLDSNDEFRYSGPITAGKTVEMIREIWFDVADRPQDPLVVQLRLKRIISPRDDQRIADFITHQARLHIDPKTGTAITPTDDLALPIHEVLGGPKQ